MFNMFIEVPSRTSTAVRSLKVDALASQAVVEFNTGYIYAYGNVSKRAIANVLFNPDVSLGFWVNNNCINSERAYETSTTRDVAVGRLKRALAKEAQLPSFA